MQEPPYSELAQQRALSESIIAAAGGLMASDTKVIYFVQAGDDGPIKIGYCHKFSGVRKRMNELQTGCPWPLVVRRIIPATSGIYSERQLHQHFEQYRLSGEWFEAAEPVAIAANATPSTTALQHLLVLAWERGRACARAFDTYETIQRISDDMRGAIERWESCHAPDARDDNWEKTCEADVAALLERPAA